MQAEYTQNVTPVSGGVFIETYGCQMNLVDSEIVMSMLEERGYRRVDSAEEAELILINTCAVREHAEVKAISNIARYKPLAESSARRVGILGCLSRHTSDTLAQQLPFVNWIMGPDAYRRLPALLAEPSPETPLIVPEGKPEELYDDVLPSRRSGINAWVTISRGCDNHCTYCVVPATRGHLRHRPFGSILEEVREAVDQGFIQVTLLGQNVNSYEDDEHDFAALLDEVSKIPGLKRLRFMTSHPKDLSDRLLDVMAESDVLCPELHLPLQAGNDHILKRMNRVYTSDHYLELVEKARRRVPDLLLSTDLIVGFPGETDEQYRDTARIVENVGYDNAFIYKYSERPNTPAAKLDDNVPNVVKVQRLMHLNEIVRASGQQRRLMLVGRTFPVLIEGQSSRDEAEQMGRTPAGHVVIVPGDFAVGEVVETHIQSLSGYTLRGTSGLSRIYAQPLG